MTLILGWVLVIFGITGYIVTYFKESNDIFPWTLIFLASGVIGTVFLAANGVDIMAKR